MVGAGALQAKMLKPWTCVLGAPSGTSSRHKRSWNCIGMFLIEKPLLRNCDLSHTFPQTRYASHEILTPRQHVRSITTPSMQGNAGPYRAVCCDYGSDRTTDQT